MTSKILSSYRHSGFITVDTTVTDLSEVECGKGWIIDKAGTNYLEEADIRLRGLVTEYRAGDTSYYNKDRNAGLLMMMVRKLPLVIQLF